jgi:glycosyltransferase involved in cell wall biosynthesis
MARSGVGDGAARVSVIMPVRDEARAIREAVESLLQQELPGLELEILAVDGRSTDGTREILEELAGGEPRLRVVDNPHRLTPHAMNLGLREASGDYVCIFGSHTAYDRDYIGVCVRELEDRGAAGCSGRVTVVPADESVGAELVAWTLSSSFASSGKSFRTAPEGWADTLPYPLFRRRTLTDLGGYNERLARNQDNDMNERVRAAGGSLYLTWQTGSRYRAQAGVRALMRYAYRNGFWNFVTLRENPRAMRLRHFMPMLFVIGSAGLIVAAAVAIVLGAEPAVALIAFAPIAAHLVVGFGVGLRKAVATRRLAPLLMPLAILGFHASYGIGMLTAILRRARPPETSTAPGT